MEGPPKDSLGKSLTNTSVATLSRHSFAEVEADGAFSPSGRSTTASESSRDPHDVDDAGPRRTRGEAARQAVGPAVGSKRGRSTFDADLQRAAHARIADESKGGPSHSAGMDLHGSTSSNGLTPSKDPDCSDTPPTKVDGLPDAKRARQGIKRAESC